ncbi:SDR family NAD(P)-dependent oxidoreductase [Arachidicoccus sp.]|uniref:SDR family NAD(P)-dependent oxidoreductase n=1 Tax=Arachidicoccus sp. TaxID=1872624 RepID=UPI003D208EA8
MTKTILITGASRGFGKIWAEAFLKRGDNVIVTSRNVAQLQDLVSKYGNSVLPLELDITNKADCITVVNEAREHFGHIDTLINNAGYTVFGAIEENSEKEARDLFDANVFGTLWMTQAVLPIFREQGKGHIIQLSSVLGINSLPTMGLYCATKYAVEGFSEALQMEVKELGINVTLIEPNSFQTDFFGTSAIASSPIDAYTKVTYDFQHGEGVKLENIGDPNATVEAILEVVDAQNPPLRLFLGKLAYPWTQYTYGEKLASWEAWKEVSLKAHGH